jgi:hypothetical protein
MSTPEAAYVTTGFVIFIALSMIKTFYPETFFLTFSARGGQTYKNMANHVYAFWG